MREYLKVKIVSLADEAVTIRREEQKAKKSLDYFAGKQGSEDALRRQKALFFGLKDHRRGIVRDEARWSLLAYGYIRGRKYSDMEKGVDKSFMANSGWHNGVKIKRVIELVLKYGEIPLADRNPVPEQVKKWLDT